MMTARRMWALVLVPVNLPLLEQELDLVDPVPLLVFRIWLSRLLIKICNFFGTKFGGGGNGKWKLKGRKEKEKAEKGTLKNDNQQSGVSVNLCLNVIHSKTRNPFFKYSVRHVNPEKY